VALSEVLHPVVNAPLPVPDRSTGFPNDPVTEPHMIKSRRQFILTLVPATMAISAAPSVLAAAAPRVDEATDPVAKSLFYSHDASKVDAGKLSDAAKKKYAKDQKCGNCQFFQGKAGEAWGPCPFFNGKQVNANGWCASWNKKLG
jgi:hypothetical protein